MLRLAVVFAVCLTGCQSIEEVALSLTVDSACTTTDLEQVKTLSIEAFAQNGECKLAHSCAFNVSAEDVTGFEAALRGAGDVLLDLTADDVQLVTVNGRPLNDCFPRQDGMNAPRICGSANVAAVSDGQLDILLQCGTCIETLELCP